MEKLFSCASELTEKIYHETISARLVELDVEPVFLAIHAGEMVPPLTDYFVRRIPDQWNSPVPAELVDGRDLTPLFIGCDSYAIYCVDNSTHEIIEIDPEDPWPPSAVHPDWKSFVANLYDIMSQHLGHDQAVALRGLLALD